MLNEMFIAKKLVLFVSIIISILANSFLIDALQLNQVALFSEALNGIVKGYYVKNNSSLDFLIANNKASNIFASAVITNIMKVNAHLIGPVTISTFDDSKNDKINLSRSTIIFVDQYSTTGRLLSRAKMDNADTMRFQHYEVIKTSFSGSKLNFGVERVYDFDIVNYANFVFHKSGNHLELAALLTMSDISCAVKFKWIHDDFHDQYSVTTYNFCEVVVAYQMWKEGIIHIFIEFLFKILGDEFDFIPNFKYYSTPDEVYEWPREPSFAFLIKDLEVIFITPSDKFHFFKFANIDVALLVSTGELYGMFEKLALPFDQSTWILISMLIIGIFCYIFAETNE